MPLPAPVTMAILGGVATGLERNMGRGKHEGTARRPDQDQLDAMKILVTGAAGFLGSRLIRSVLSSKGLPNVSGVVAADLIACPVQDGRVDSRTGSITDEPFIASIVDPDIDLVFHLAAALSGQSEAEFDVGMR